jgi:phosphatidylinositol kinase/protein kinase (PI-3  family)
MVFLQVMSVLRENRDSVMAMLEAFVYDPLISWRLLVTNDAAETAVPIASGNLRSHASNEDDLNSKSTVEQLRVPIGGAGSLLNDGGGLAGGAVSPVGRNQSMRNQSMREMKAQLAAGGPVPQDGEPLQENLNAR